MLKLFSISAMGNLENEPLAALGEARNFCQALSDVRVAFHIQMVSNL